MPRSSLLITGLVSALLLTGCSSLNPFASNKPANPPAALQNFSEKAKAHTVWSVAVGSAKSYTLTPISVGRDLFAAAADGTLVRIDQQSGRVIWRINTGSSLTAGVGSDGKTIAVVTEQGKLLAFNEQGQAIWNVQLSSEVLSSPAVGAGVVIVRSSDNQITAFDADNGARRWSTREILPPLTLRNAPGILVDGAMTYLGLPGGQLLALATRDGSALWKATVARARGVTELERVVDIGGNPVVFNRQICAVAYQGQVACFEALSGRPLWSKTTSSTTGLAMDDQAVFVSSPSGQTTRFDTYQGNIVWNNQEYAYRGLSVPAKLDAGLAVGDEQGFIHLLNSKEGSTIGRTSLGSAVTYLATVDGDLLAYTQSGVLNRIHWELR